MRKSRCLIASRLPDEGAQFPPRFAHHLRHASLRAYKQFGKLPSSNLQSRHDIQIQTQLPTLNLLESMVPLTRRQSIIKATNMTKQEAEDELPQHTEPVPVLSRLPVELQKTVVEYVCPYPCHLSTASLTNTAQLVRPADLKSLCLVSKELRTLTLPYLYRDVTLKVHQLDADLSLTSSSSHPGLSHTRSLRIKERGSRLFDVKEHSRTLYRLLSLLPKNGLRVFE